MNPPQIADKAEDLMPDEQANDQMREAATAPERQVGARHSDGQSGSVISEHTITMPLAGLCSDHRAADLAGGPRLRAISCAAPATGKGAKTGSALQDGPPTCSVAPI